MMQDATRGAPAPEGGEFRDYTPPKSGGWRQLFARRSVAAVVLAIAVLFGTLYGSHRSLQALKPEIRGTRLEQLLDARAGMLALLEKDAGNSAKIRAELIGLDDQIKRDPYHEDAERFNDTLTRVFPANVLGRLTGVTPAPVF